MPRGRAINNVPLVMTVQVAVGVYAVVNVLSMVLLRSSGVWRVLFAPFLDLAPDRTPDPLRQAPRGWIENHSFWDLTEQPDAAEDDEVAFWGQRRRSVG